MAQAHEYLTIEYSEEEVWLTWTDKNKEQHEKSVRQLAQEARAGNAHDENVLSYYRCCPCGGRAPAASAGPPAPSCPQHSLSRRPPERPWVTPRPGLEGAHTRLHARFRNKGGASHVSVVHCPPGPAPRPSPSLTQTSGPCGAGAPLTLGEVQGTGTERQRNLPEGTELWGEHGAHGGKGRAEDQAGHPCQTAAHTHPHSQSCPRPARGWLLTPSPCHIPALLSAVPLLPTPVPAEQKAPAPLASWERFATSHKSRHFPCPLAQNVPFLGQWPVHGVDPAPLPLSQVFLKPPACQPPCQALTVPPHAGTS